MEQKLEHFQGSLLVLIHPGFFAFILLLLWSFNISINEATIKLIEDLHKEGYSGCNKSLLFKDTFAFPAVHYSARHKGGFENTGSTLVY